MSEPKAQQEPSMEEILASIRRIISEDGAGEPRKPEPAAAPEEQSEASESDDVLDLVEVVEEEPPPAEPEPVAEDAQKEEEDEVELRAEPEPAPSPSPPSPLASDGGLMSPPTADSATSMLSSLVQAVDASRRGTPIGQGNRTIEDLVKEVMRPMIRDWLDAHLPGLVERLVRREIERLARDAEGDG